MYLQNRVKAFDNFNDYGIEPVEIDIKKCIKYVSRAWDSVTGTTIENCWKKADILPEEDEINDIDIYLELERLKELEEVQVLINKLDFDNPFNAEEFVQYDKSETTGEMMSDEEILKEVLPDEQEKEVEEVHLPAVTHNEAIDSYDKVISYLEQHENDDDDKKEELKFIKKLRKEALKQRFISAKQGNLNNFINVVE